MRLQAHPRTARAAAAPQTVTAAPPFRPESDRDDGQEIKELEERGGDAAPQSHPHETVETPPVAGVDLEAISAEDLKYARASQ